MFNIWKEFSKRLISLVTVGCIIGSSLNFIFYLRIINQKLIHLLPFLQLRIASMVTGGFKIQVFVDEFEIFRDFVTGKSLNQFL